MNKKRINFIIDFDSTFVQVEALEELARIALHKSPAKKQVLKEISRLTRLAMEGEIGFEEALKRRIKLIKPHKRHIEQLISSLKQKISPSILRNRQFFIQFSENIYIITGGFREYVEPIVADFGIESKNVFANNFVYDSAGIIVGVDEENPLFHDNGKVELLRRLHLPGDIYVIGDGYTDYQMKESGLVNRFYAYTENIERKKVTERADYVLPSFDEFLYVNKLPMTISYPKNRIRVLLLEGIHQNAEKIMHSEGYHVEVIKKSLNQEELIERIKNLSILGIRSKTRLSADVIKNARRLYAIGAFCIGTNQIDLDYCTENGIIVFNAPFSNTRSVVELAIGEMIMLARKVPERNHELHSGFWRKTASGCTELRGKKLGIIGYGKIGSQLSVLAEMLGMEVYYYDIEEKLVLGTARKCNTMEELLRKCDFISLHVDGRATNRNLIGEEEFARMKKGVIFLNLSRGFVVDQAALIRYLQNGKIKGAAIDVFPEEPGTSKATFKNELRNFHNVILTPHIGGSTMEAQRDIADYVSDRIIDYINTGSTVGSVNFPQLRLSPVKNAHRLLHIHKNVPGVLAKVNSIVSKYHLNILSQELKTNDRIGYLCMDVDKKYRHEVIDELRRIPETIKFRTLY